MLSKLDKQKKVRKNLEGQKRVLKLSLKVGWILFVWIFLEKLDRHCFFNDLYAYIILKKIKI